MSSNSTEAPLRKLMGPGPLDVHPRVYRALTSPVIGHMDPAYFETLDRIGEQLRKVFQTQNRLTHATPGTGTSGMEACVANLVEPEDAVLVCVHGYFGDRLRQMAERQEAAVTVIEGEWGRPTDPQQVKEAFGEKQYKLIALVHAETSTGVRQPMDDILRLAKENGVMVLLDTVTSLGGVEIKADEWGLDAAYSCSQKCIGAPPGLAPVTFSDRAVEAARNRKHPIRSWYLDITLLDKYWGSPPRVYHHTSSSTLNYALLEALLLIEEEGLQNRFERHLKNHQALVAGVEAMGLEMLVKPEHRLPTLNAVRVPESVDEAKIRSYLLETFNLEIGAGLGALAGQIWRVGLMGYSSSAENVLFFLTAISRALAVQGCKTDLPAGSEAAMSLLNA
jgi:alanine-glyoxylate transaminase/serine-glyoxylate transaminase/serine-pyruvate transaminase